MYILFVRNYSLLVTGKLQKNSFGDGGGRLDKLAVWLIANFIHSHHDFSTIMSYFEINQVLILDIFVNSMTFSDTFF